MSEIDLAPPGQVARPRRTPAKAWEEMVRGNERFVRGEPQHPRQDVERREALVGKQTPDAALFGCSDSRLAAEIIFDKGIGDLFVVRNAGQVISESVIGSLEYAVSVLDVPLIVVLGHDQCGAVLAAIESQGAEAPTLPPHIGLLISKIIPAVRRVGRSARVLDVGTIDVKTIDVGTIDVKTIDSQDVGREHLRDTITELLETSELISDAVAAGTLAVVGANYRLLEGQAVPDVILGMS
jgi:carbonic anhydrase